MGLAKWLLHSTISGSDAKMISVRGTFMPQSMTKATITFRLVMNSSSG